MSGIAGIIDLEGAPVEPELIGRMTARMRYRGPDGIRHWQGSAIALGHCMLHTTQESLEEVLPLANETGSVVLVFDGRVDNWKQLRRRLLLKGVVLRSRADGELALRAYECWGSSFLEHIDGDFALVIWDAENHTVFCARDRLGNKPLYYHIHNNRLVFASDLAAILVLPHVRRLVNEAMLVEFMAASWRSREETLWQGILRLPAAHVLTVSRDRVQRYCYWQPDLDARLSCSSTAEYIEQYRSLLQESVQQLSRSHRPVAIEVSGGLDSSAILAVAVGLQRQQELLSPGFTAWTMDCSKYAEADEMAFIKDLTAFLNVKIHACAPVLPPVAWFAQQVEQSLDFPLHPNFALAGELFSSAANGSRVSFNGRGGDEWLSGTLLHYADSLRAGAWRGLRESWRADSAAFGMSTALCWLVRHGILELLPAGGQAWMRATANTLRNRKTALAAADWLAPQIAERLAQGRFAMPQPAEPRSGQQQLLHSLNDAYGAWCIEVSERLYAGHGLEPRSPLNTTSIVQFMASVPERLKLRGDTQKFLHVQAMRDLLPPSIVNRRSKADFSFAFHHQLVKMEDEFVRGLACRRPDWTQPAAIAALYRTYRNGSAGGWPQYYLWHLFACDLFDVSASGIVDNPAS